MSEKRLPSTLVEAIRYFDDIDLCTQFIAEIRWPDGAVCPSCEGREHSYLTTRRLWKCKACKRQFSVKVGTIFEDSSVKLKNWLAAIWLITNSKNGISSYELGRAIGVQQRTAWFMEQRIRLALQMGTFDKFDGEVETDETFIGGKTKNLHKHERDRRAVGGGTAGKTMVVGSLIRGKDDKPSQVRAEPLLNSKWYGPNTHVRTTVEPGAALYTDTATAYKALRANYKHSTVDHSRGEYARGTVSTNGIENFWSLLKRSLQGTYISVQEQHLFRYVDERVFAFNLRHLTDYERFRTALQYVTGRRLTYAELTGN